MESADGGTRRTAGRARRKASRGRGYLMDAGVLAYRPTGPEAPGTWDAGYEAGDFDYYGSPVEAPRYGVLLGLLATMAREAAVLDVGCGTGIQRGTSTTCRSVATSAAASPRWRSPRLRRPVMPARRSSSAPCHRPRRGPSTWSPATRCSHYLPDPRGELRAIRQRVPPGGHLLTSLFEHRGQRALHRLVAEQFDVIGSYDLVRRRPTPSRWRLEICEGPAHDTDTIALREPPAREPPARARDGAVQAAWRHTDPEA